MRRWNASRALQRGDIRKPALSVVTTEERAAYTFALFRLNRLCRPGLTGGLMMNPPSATPEGRGSYFVRRRIQRPEFMSLA